MAEQANPLQPSQQPERLLPLPLAMPGLITWIRDLAISLAVSAFVIVFLYQPVKVEGGSMMPSLDDRSVSSSINLCIAWSRSSGVISSCSATLAIPPKLYQAGDRRGGGPHPH